MSGKHVSASPSTPTRKRKTLEAAIPAGCRPRGRKKHNKVGKTTSITIHGGSKEDPSEGDKLGDLSFTIKPISSAPKDL